MRSSAGILHCGIIAVYLKKKLKVSACVDIQSLCGHTSPVESVAFDSAEVLVLAGASAGAIKLWDLEEAKSKLMNQFIFLFS